MIHARAPGKLFVSGEYAVLSGAPAIACAVSRYVRVRVLDGGAQEAEEAARWREAGEDLILGGSASGAAPRRRLEIDSQALYAIDGAKYGLGSSAAVAAAVTGALLASRGSLPAISEQLRVATALHRARQGVGGSGVDVAASLYGGVVAVTAGRVERLDWPRGLVCAVLSSGRPAHTGSAVERFRAAMKGGSRELRGALNRLEAEAETVKRAWRSGARAALKALERYAAAWQALDRAGELGVYSAPHRELLGLARASDCFYKPSGAGGGDCGLALARDRASIDSMRRSAAAKGYQSLHMHLAAQGMSVTQQ